MIQAFTELWVNWWFPKPKWVVSEVIFTGPDLGIGSVKLRGRLILSPVKWVIGPKVNWMLRVYVEFVTHEMFPDTGDLVAIIDFDKHGESNAWADIECDAVVTLVKGSLGLCLYRGNEKMYHFVNTLAAPGLAEVIPSGAETMIDILKARVET